MTPEALVARIDDEGDVLLVRSPAVGVLDRVPRRGLFLGPGEGFAILRVLGRRLGLLLPRSAQGWVFEELCQGTFIPVEYNQPLCRLRRDMQGQAEIVDGHQTHKGPEAGQDLVPVIAPSEGIFYRRPGPDRPPYVEPGATVQAGAVLGLVEVMKSFNQIIYGGPTLPERGIVAQILVEDATEVAFGQPLLLIRPC